MARRFNETITPTKAAPLPAEVAHLRGCLKPVDRHKRQERRRVRRQEERAWRRELAELYAA